MRRELLFNNYVEPVLVKLVLESNIQEWGAYSGASDPLEDLGPHQFDLLRYLFNRELVAVKEDGIMAECLAAHGNGYREHVTVQYKHHRYQIRMDSERMRPAKGVFRWILDRYDWMHRLRNRDQPPMLLSYERQLTHFINCIRRGVAPNPGIACGIAAVRAVEAARESIVLNGRRILI
jgi:predicted dehydrogenase